MPLSALCRLQNCRELVSELGLDNVIQFKVSCMQIRIHDVPQGCTL